jgi:ABC-type phosphate/phosphonate transport system substrate-binding protein
MLMNARMYSVTESSKLAWKSVFDWVAKRSGIRGVRWLEHEPPLLISDMWKRDDLICVMMCGVPLFRRDLKPHLLASVVPRPDRYGGKSVYMTDIVVLENTPYQSLKDTFGGIAGYTVPDSQSGYFAFRMQLMQFQTKESFRLYSKAVGGLLNARGVISALVRREIDVGPLDGYVFDLIKNGDPNFASQVRVIATTSPTTMPPIVATADLSSEQVTVLQTAFKEASSTDELAEERATLLIDKFITPKLEDYEELNDQENLVESIDSPWPN